MNLCPDRPGQAEVDLHAFLGIPRRHQRRQRAACRPDGDAAAAVRGIFLHALKAAHRASPYPGHQRTVAVEHLALSAVVSGLPIVVSGRTAGGRSANCQGRFLSNRPSGRPVIDLPVIRLVEHGLRPAGSVFRIHRPVKGVEGRAFRFFQIFHLPGQAVYPLHQLHPGHRDAGFQHQAVVFRPALHQRGMIEQLMPTAGASHNGGLRLQQSVRKAHHRLSPFFAFSGLRVEKQALKAGHQLVGLRHRILIRAELILIRGLKNGKALRPAVFHDVVGKIQIPFLRFQKIQPHHRLQDGAGIDPEPVVRGLRDGKLPLLLSDMADDMIQMPPRRLQDLTPERFVPTDLIKMDQAEKHIFPAPEVPAVKFLLPAVGGDPAVLLLAGQQVPHRFR